VPVHYPKQLFQIIKCITGTELFDAEVKKILWGGHFWTSGYYINTVGQYGNEEVIRKYIKKQGTKYQKIYSQQLSLFD